MSVSDYSVLRETAYFLETIAGQGGPFSDRAAEHATRLHRQADQAFRPEALPPELTAEMRANVVEANRSRVAKGFEPFLKVGSEGWALELIYAELRRDMNKEGS